MSFVVYNKRTAKLVREPNVSEIRNYKTATAAKSALTRMVRKGMKRGDLAIADTYTFWNSVDILVTRKNLLTGKEYSESVNTPNCCSPASETYWSM